MQRYEKSLAHLEHARLWTPTGAQTISKAPERFPVGAYPIYLERGRGAHAWDIDGNKYLDFICGLASMTLGYCHPAIEEAIGIQLRDGISFSLSTKLESQVAERLCSIFPCGKNGSVRWVKTGSEAAEAAIRVARRATGRDIIVTVGGGYHAWHSWFSACKPSHPGVPIQYEELVRSFDYNDLSSLVGVLDRDVAAVILEPALNEKPDDHFLEEVKNLAHDAGALLIFDEVVCAGRWAEAGGQQYFDVTPDLATAGKGLANGMPLGCLIGSRELMQYADVVSGTFGGEALSLAACNAVLDIYQQESIIDTLWALGVRFQEGFNDLAQVLDVPVLCDGFAVKPRIQFKIQVQQYLELKDIPFPRAEASSIEQVKLLAMSLFLQETALRGILWHPAGGNISAAMTEQDIDMALVAMGEALTIVKQALDSGDWSALKGKPIQATPYVRKG